MKLSEIAGACGLEIVHLPQPDTEVTAAYTSDLLSDVMAHCPEDSLLISVQNHKNSIAVCTLVGAHAVIIAHNRPIPEDMLESARQEGIALFRSRDDQFTLSCRIGGLLGS